VSVATAPDPLRYEVKYVAQATELHRVLTWARSNRAGFVEPFPPRQVNTSARSKVRFRWYGELDQPERGTLEVKRRRGGVGWKLSYPVGPVPLSGTSWRRFRGALREQLPGEARIWLDANPQPVLINRYRRRYFLSGDGRVRLTVDWDQRVYDERHCATPNLTRLANLPDTVVVELKFDRADRKIANRHAQGIPLRLSRNSKYVIGVQAIRHD